MNIIDSFRGEYEFLSNFYMVDITINNFTYKSVEHYFQSMKANNIREEVSIRNSRTPSEAKRLGNICNPKSDWDEIRYEIMLIGVRESSKIKNYLIY